MSRFSYTTLLDRKYAKKSEVQAKFDELAAFHNVPSLTGENFRQMAVRYRHLQMPPTIEISARKTDSFTGNMFGAISHGGWYLCSDTILKIDFQHTGLANLYEANRNVVQFRCKFHCCNGDRGGGGGVGLTALRLGRSNDNGMTWTTWAQTERPAGLMTSGSTNQFFNGTQNNPYTFAAGYVPFNVPLDRHVILEAALGGNTLFRTGASSGNIWVALFANSTVETLGSFKAHLFGSARWLEATP